MSTPTEKPVDDVVVTLSEDDFYRVVGNAMHEVLNKEYGGRIEVTNVTPMADSGWRVGTLFIPEEKE